MICGSWGLGVIPFTIGLKVRVNIDSTWGHDLSHIPMLYNFPTCDTEYFDRCMEAAFDCQFGVDPDTVSFCSGGCYEDCLTPWALVEQVGQELLERIEVASQAPVVVCIVGSVVLVHRCKIMLVKC